MEESSNEEDANSYIVALYHSSLEAHITKNSEIITY